MKKKAIWNGHVIAESSGLVNIEGNYYFPKSGLNMEYFKENETNIVCYWNR